MKNIGLILVLLCLAAVPMAAQVPDEFTNLKVFPEDIGKRELIGAMRSFAGALGVRCNHCHVGPDNLEGMDFSTDELEPKRVARAMMAMTDEINSTLLPASKRESPMRVQCVTCHRGIARPAQIGDVLSAAVEEGGVDGALERYRELREEHYGSSAYDFSPNALNSLAEMMAREKSDMAAAIKVVEANIEYNPNESYPRLMLAQLRMQTGDKDGAIKAAQQALELEPDNRFARQMLERLEAAE